MNDIKKLSNDAQTSCLEGYHATLNFWHPKMICFSWMGTYCRYIILLCINKGHSIYISVRGTVASWLVCLSCQSGFETMAGDTLCYVLG